MHENASKIALSATNRKTLIKVAYLMFALHFTDVSEFLEAV